MALGVPPEGGAVYDTALTHSSFASENDSAAHNERLEWLGDAILDAVVADHIFSTYPELTEGEMQRLRASVVNTSALAEVAREVGLGDRIRLGKGEEASGGRDKDNLLADCFEAVLAAVYIDRGIDAVRSRFLPLFADKIRRGLVEGGPMDAKSALQERVMKETGTLPSYAVVAMGPDHAKRFSATVRIRGLVAGEGTGRSKKAAELDAAGKALRDLGKSGRKSDGARAS